MSKPFMFTHFLELDEVLGRYHFAEPGSFAVATGIREHTKVLSATVPKPGHGAELVFLWAKAKAG